MTRTPVDPTYPLFPIFSIIGFFVCIIPLPWHVHAWNAGTCAFMVWTGILCLVNAVNAVVWSGSIENFAPIWCDISTQIMLGAGVGIPAATLCISRRLYHITTIQTVSVTPQDKRRSLIVDLSISVGLPILLLLLHIIVHPHRFDILQDVGCYPVTYNTLPSYFLYFMWPGVLGVISFVYSTMNLRSFWRRRIQFSQFISSSTPMSVSRYLRLMTLAVVDMMFTVPLSIFTIYSGTHGVTMAPWISWSDTHFDFGHVDVFPTILWRSQTKYKVSVELTRWVPVFTALVFFALFGFAAEAKKHYRLVFWWTAKHFGYYPAVKRDSKLAYPSWKQTPSGHIAALNNPPLAYASQRSPGTPKCRPVSIVSSVADSDFELRPYMHVDVEKSAGTVLDSPSTSSTIPPEYISPRATTSSSWESDGYSPSDPSCSLPDDGSGRGSLHITVSGEAIYISDAFAIAPRPSLDFVQHGDLPQDINSRSSTPTFHDPPITLTHATTPSQQITYDVPIYHRSFTPSRVDPIQALGPQESRESF